MKTAVTEGLVVNIFPNPSTDNFTLNVSAKTNERIIMQVIDMYGRVIETRNITANSITKFGDRYSAGSYFARIMQGNKQKQIKLVKLSN
jgi:hypothetical protein